MIMAKPQAMLSSQLLARKGTAIPAALGLQFGLIEELTANPITPRLELRVTPQRPGPAGGTSGGANNSGNGQSGSSVPPPTFTPGPAPDRADGAKVSLRLDADRHRRLRLLALHQRSSGQKLLLAALDAYLDEMSVAVMGGACACLRSRPS